MCQSSTLQNIIHNNLFTRVEQCIILSHDSITQNADDTWIYYNKFVDCPGSGIFSNTGSSASQIHNTVIAYNDFGTTVTNLSIETYVNTMVYGNIGMADFNVPSPLPIPPP